MGHDKPIKHMSFSDRHRNVDGLRHPDVCYWCIYLLDVLHVYAGDVISIAAGGWFAYRGETPIVFLEIALPLEQEQMLALLYMPRLWREAIRGSVRATFCFDARQPFVYWAREKAWEAFIEKWVNDRVTWSAIPFSMAVSQNSGVGSRDFEMVSGYEENLAGSKRMGALLGLIGAVARSWLEFEVRDKTVGLRLGEVFPRNWGRVIAFCKGMQGLTMHVIEKRTTEERKELEQVQQRLAHRMRGIGGAGSSGAGPSGAVPIHAAVTPLSKGKRGVLKTPTSAPVGVVTTPPSRKGKEPAVQTPVTASTGKGLKRAATQSAGASGSHKKAKSAPVSTPPPVDVKGKGKAPAVTFKVPGDPVPVPSKKSSARKSSAQKKKEKEAAELAAEEAEAQQELDTKGRPLRRSSRIR